MAGAAFSVHAAKPRYGVAELTVPDDENEAIFRPYANGAGPTAIFRMGRASDGASDLFGVVDPVGWRVQFFRLEDWKPGGAAPLSSRLHWQGACRLPPDRRVWRVYALPDRVVLQLQPISTLDDVRAGKALVFPKIVLAADSAALQAIETQEPSLELDQELTTPSCGGAPDYGSLPGFTAQDASYHVGGGEHKDFKVTPALGQSTFMRSTVTIPARATLGLNPTGGVLASVQELEPALSATRQVALRHFLVVSRSDAVPGFSRSTVAIVRKSDGGKLNGLLQIDTGIARLKSGQRFAAISSTGEVLLIGAARKDAFLLRACHFTDAARARTPCTVGKAAPSTADGSGDSQNQATGGSPSAPSSGAVGQPRDIWDRAEWYLNQVYKIDASTPDFSDKCRQALKGCDPNGNYPGAWNVISGLRFAHGLYERRGVPYAQRQTKAGTPTEAQPTADLPSQRLGDGTVLLPVRQVEGGVVDIVSDINNAGLPSGDVDDLRLFGIDCSTFLAALWKRDPEPTLALLEDARHNTLKRVRHFGEMSEGDAFTINLVDEQKHTLINHVVVFVKRADAAPGDSSQGVVVLESSSSCGGVCLSVYDESFLDGWTLISRGKPDFNAVFPDIPKDYAAWMKLRSDSTDRR